MLVPGCGCRLKPPHHCLMPWPTRHLNPHWVWVLSVHCKRCWVQTLIRAGGKAPQLFLGVHCHSDCSLHRSGRALNIAVWLACFCFKPLNEGRHSRTAQLCGAARFALYGCMLLTCRPSCASQHCCCTTAPSHHLHTTRRRYHSGLQSTGQ